MDEATHPGLAVSASPPRSGRRGWLLATVAGASFVPAENINMLLQVPRDSYVSVYLTQTDGLRLLPLLLIVAGVCTVGVVRAPTPRSALTVQGLVAAAALLVVALVSATNSNLGSFGMRAALPEILVIGTLAAALSALAGAAWRRRSQR